MVSWARIVYVGAGDEGLAVPLARCWVWQLVRDNARVAVDRERGRVPACGGAPGEALAALSLYMAAVGWLRGEMTGTGAAWRRLRQTLWLVMGFLVVVWWCRLALAKAIGR